MSSPRSHDQECCERRRRDDIERATLERVRRARQRGRESVSALLLPEVETNHRSLSDPNRTTMPGVSTERHHAASPALSSSGPVRVPREIARASYRGKSLVYWLLCTNRDEEATRLQIAELELEKRDRLLLRKDLEEDDLHRSLRRERTLHETAALRKRQAAERAAALRQRVWLDEAQDRAVIGRVEDRAFRELVSEHRRLQSRMQTLDVLRGQRSKAAVLRRAYVDDERAPGRTYTRAEGSLPTRSPSSDCNRGDSPCLTFALEETGGAEEHSASADGRCSTDPLRTTEEFNVSVLHAFPAPVVSRRENFGRLRAHHEALLMQSLAKRESAEQQERSADAAAWSREHSIDVGDSTKAPTADSPSDLLSAASTHHSAQAFAALLQRVGRGYLLRSFGSRPLASVRERSSSSEWQRDAWPCPSSAISNAGRRITHRHHSPPSHAGHSNSGRSASPPITGPDVLLGRVMRMRRHLFPELTQPAAYSGMTADGGSRQVRGRSDSSEDAESEPLPAHVTIYDAKASTDARKNVREAHERTLIAMRHDAWNRRLAIHLREQESLTTICDAKRAIAVNTSIVKMRRERAARLRKEKEKQAELLKERRKFMKRDMREVELLELHVSLRQQFLHESREAALRQSLIEVPGAERVAGLTASCSFQATVRREKSALSPPSTEEVAAETLRRQESSSSRSTVKRPHRKRREFEQAVRSCGATLDPVKVPSSAFEQPQPSSQADFHPDPAGVL